MRYKPERDIPKACMELKTTSPSKVLEWIRQHRTEIDLKTKKRRQCTIKVHAVIMWMKRHPKVMEKIERKLKDEALSRTVVSETDFENGAFREIDSVKTWILELTGREAKTTSINSMVNDLKRICRGIVRKRGIKKQPKPEDYEVIEGWGLKHPDRLSLEDGLTYLSEMKKRGHDTRQYRLTLRNFLQSKGIKGYHKISGKIGQYGKYAHIFAPKNKIDTIFHEVGKLNVIAKLASKFAYKCGGVRLRATLTAHSTKFHWDGEHHTIFVEEKATRGKEKRIQEKLIPNDFWEEIKHLKGVLFPIHRLELNAILRSAYNKVIPELSKEIRMPFHFWRHQFAQHGLRQTNWNYGLIARLGHWTVETLERYYGKMDRQTAFRSGSQFLPKL